MAAAATLYDDKTSYYFAGPDVITWDNVRRRPFPGNPFPVNLALPGLTIQPALVSLLVAVEAAAADALDTVAGLVAFAAVETLNLKPPLLLVAALLPKLKPALNSPPLALDAITALSNAWGGDFR